MTATPPNLETLYEEFKGSGGVLHVPVEFTEELERIFAAPHILDGYHRHEFSWVSLTENNALHRDDDFPYSFSLSKPKMVWWKNGIVHRMGGPSAIADGYMLWNQYGLMHRLDGPAAQYFGTDDEQPNRWYLFGQQIPETRFNEFVDFMGEHDLHPEVAFLLFNNSIPAKDWGGQGKPALSWQLKSLAAFNLEGQPVIDTWAKAQSRVENFSKK